MKPGLVGSIKSGTIGSSIGVALILGVEKGLSSLSLSISLSPLAVFDMPFIVLCVCLVLT